MPWSPTLRQRPDPRFDRYRNRCAALTRDGVLVGHVLILTGQGAEQRGGHLWWRKWGPECEYLEPLVQLLDGRDFDDPVRADTLESELEYWSRGKFPLLGKSLDMVWLSPDEALRVAPGVFGVSYCLDNDGQVIWSFADGPASNTPSADGLAVSVSGDDLFNVPWKFGLEVVQARPRQFDGDACHGVIHRSDTTLEVLAPRALWVLRLASMYSWGRPSRS